MDKSLFRTRTQGKIPSDEIRLFVDAFLGLASRYERLERYYRAENVTIKQTKKREAHAPNNQVVNAYAKYITDMMTGYFMGKPVAYGAAFGGERLLDYLRDIYDYNDEEAENLELAKAASVAGVAYELLYTDADGRLRFAFVPANEMFVIYDASIENKIVCAVRTYAFTYGNGQRVRYVEAYDSESVRYYNDDGGFHLTEERPHYWSDVPVVVYENNRERLGDFEPVLSLIDAYDRTQSDTLNDMEQFTDAYLVLRNMSGTDAEDVAKMKEDRVLLLDDDGEAAWLVKSCNDTWVENYKKRLNNDIHKFSATPDLSDESFGSNLSGVSLRYKLFGMEQARSVKERYFKKGLQRRIELLCNMLKITNTAEDYTLITMVFNNSLPQNILESSQVVGNLSPYLSQETLLSLLPFVSDPTLEIEKKEREEEEKADGNMARMMSLKEAQDASASEETEEG